MGNPGGDTMPTPAKALDNMSKNLTDEERRLREQAEEGVIPDRGRESRFEKPAIMTGNPAAGRYWRKVLERMDGLVILDDLDSDALGVYCVMMARYEVQCRLLAQAAKELKKARDDPEAVEEAAAKLDAASGKMQSLERNILQYAEKLGLTPSGRVRLAQKRAQAAAEARTDPDSDLYGD
nr:MAG TPA: terminase small subunit [Caudoviricetes sp.]